MSKQSVPAFPRDQRLAAALGERIRLARLRRRMSATEMAERMGVSRMTLYSLEQGKLSVGLGVLVRALGVLGLDESLDEVAANDELGRRLQDAAARPARRASRSTGTIAAISSAEPSPTLAEDATATAGPKGSAMEMK